MIGSIGDIHGANIAVNTSKNSTSPGTSGQRLNALRTIRTVPARRAGTPSGSGLTISVNPPYEVYLIRGSITT